MSDALCAADVERGGDQQVYDGVGGDEVAPLVIVQVDRSHDAGRHGYEHALQIHSAF